MIADSLGDRLFADTKTVEDFYLQVNMLEGDKMKNKVCYEVKLIVLYTHP